MWSTFKWLRAPILPPGSKGPRTVNIVFGYFIVINYMIGTGFLGMPYAFYHAGMLSSIVTLSVVTFLSLNTSNWMLEVMSRAQALETLKHQQMSNTTPKGDEDLPSPSKGGPPLSCLQEHPQFEILLTRKFELTELCQIFVHKWLKIIFLVAMTTCGFLAMWAFSTVGGSAWATNLPLDIGPFRICSNDEFRGHLIPANPKCLASYRFCLFLFAMIVVPLSCLDLKELGFIQTIMGILRFTLIGSIVLYCLAKLIENPLTRYTVPSNWTFEYNSSLHNNTCRHYSHDSPQNFVLNFNVVGWVLSIPVFTYSQNLSPAFPSLTQPIKQKIKLQWFVLAIFGTILFCYMTLGIVVSLWFQGHINETASLNWVPLTKSGNHIALRAISYSIVLFPSLSVISTYPLVTCAVVNNLYQVIMGRDTSQRKHSYEWLILLAMRATVAILPIVCSLFISNLVYILKYAGLVNFTTSFIFPLALQLASQYKCVKVFGKQSYSVARDSPLEPDTDTEDGRRGVGEEGPLLSNENNDNDFGKEKTIKRESLSKGKAIYTTPYSIPGLSHPATVVTIGLLGGAIFVIALVSLAYSTKLSCNAEKLF